MKYDVQSAFDRVLSKDTSAEIRAVELFTLIVALHACRATIKVSDGVRPPGSTLILKVPRRTIRDARLLCSLKLLDLIEENWKAENPNSKKMSFADLQSHSGARALFSEVIQEQGSWKALRFASGIRDFEAEVKSWRREAKSVGAIIQFSLAYEKNFKHPKHKGGVTQAIQVVTSQPGQKYFLTSHKKTQLERIWSRTQAAAPLLYVLYVQKIPFFLTGIAGKRFAKKWLARAENRADILAFALTYNKVVELLTPRGYSYSAIVVPDTSMQVNVLIAPQKTYPEALRRTIADYNMGR